MIIAPLLVSLSRVWGEGWGQGAYPRGSDSRKRLLTLVRFALSTSPRAVGRGVLHPARVEVWLLAAAIALERAVFADGVRALKNPVLPRGQPREDFRFHRFRSGKAQIRFQAGERVRREARALLKEHAHFVVPIDVVERESHKPEPLRRRSIDHLAAFGFDAIDIVGRCQKTAGETRQPVRHWIGTEIGVVERDARRWLVVAVAAANQHIGAVAGER